MLPPRNPKRRLPRMPASRGVGPAHPLPEDAEMWRESMKDVQPVTRAARHKSLPDSPPLPGRADSACPVVDLHGMTEAEAFHAVCEAVAWNIEAGLKRMVVITGMGRSRPGGGVLKRELPRWLEVMPGVARFHVHGAECRIVLNVRHKP
ncbi:hypothetical protein GC177_01205 [bacterium]|nr:hypothetical protein [bacterium]